MNEAQGTAFAILMMLSKEIPQRDRGTSITVTDSEDHCFKIFPQSCLVGDPEIHAASWTWVMTKAELDDSH